MKLIRGFCILLTMLTGCTARPVPQPLLRAHAHNDYESQGSSGLRCFHRSKKKALRRFYRNVIW